MSDIMGTLCIWTNPAGGYRLNKQSKTSYYTTDFFFLSSSKSFHETSHKKKTRSVVKLQRIIFTECKLKKQKFRKLFLIMFQHKQQWSVGNFILQPKVVWTATIWHLPSGVEWMVKFSLNLWSMCRVILCLCEKGVLLMHSVNSPEAAWWSSKLSKHGFYW